MRKVTYRKASKDQGNQNPKASFGEEPRKPTGQQRSGMIFQPYDPSRRMKSYEAVKADLLQKIGHTFPRPIDIKQSLKMMKKVVITKPERKISELPDMKKQMQEQTGFNIEFDAEFKAWLKRQDQLNENLSAAYSLIQDEYLHPEIKARIENHPDFQLIDGDPIRLLEEIKVLIHSPVRGRSPWVTMLESMRRVM